MLPESVSKNSIFCRHCRMVRKVPSLWYLAVTRRVSKRAKCPSLQNIQTCRVINMMGIIIFCDTRYKLGNEVGYDYELADGMFSDVVKKRI